MRYATRHEKGQAVQGKPEQDKVAFFKILTGYLIELEAQGGVNES
jgi:hypothetical protein